MIRMAARAAERGGAEGVICPRASDIQGPPMLVVNAPMVRGGGLYPTVMPRASICLSAALMAADAWPDVSVKEDFYYIWQTKLKKVSEVGFFNSLALINRICTFCGF